MSIKGKVALIIGASGAIGSAVAQEFAKEGADVVLGTRSGSLNSLTKRIAESGVRFKQVSVEVGNLPETQHLMNTLDRDFGPISILVNASGVYGPIGPVEQNDPAAWMRAVAINIVGAFNLVHAVVPLMMKNGRGRIIHFSGGGGAYGRPFFSSYSACKAALVRFTESVALELKDKNIYVNAIAPGPVMSAMWEELRAAGPLAGSDATQELAQIDSTGGVSAERAARLAVVLARTSLPVTGKLISAVWDDWEHLDSYESALTSSDAWTLRRVSLEKE